MRRPTADEWSMITGLSIGLILCGALVWLFIRAATLTGQLVNSVLSK